MKKDDLVVLKQPQFIDVGTVHYIEEIDGERIVLSALDEQGARYLVNISDVRLPTDDQIINMLIGMVDA